MSPLDIYSDPIMLFSDCSGLLDMMDKPLADIQNQKIQKILDKDQNYHWETIHISAEENEICDAYYHAYAQEYVLMETNIRFQDPGY